jgi:PBP1b-binding outer membrane lipoprotein LpoB
MNTKCISAVIATSLVLVGCASSDRDTKASADQIRAANATPAEAPQRPVTTQMEHVQTPELAVAPPNAIDTKPPPTAVEPAPPSTVEATDPYASTEYVAENKAEFVTATDHRLKNLDKNITQVGDAIENLQADAMARKTIENLREQRLQVGQKFDELKQASQDTWMTLKASLESRVTDLEKSADEAKSKYIID